GWRQLMTKNLLSPSHRLRWALGTALVATGVLIVGMLQTRIRIELPPASRLAHRDPRQWLAVGPSVPTAGPEVIERGPTVTRVAHSGSRAVVQAGNGRRQRLAPRFPLPLQARVPPFRFIGSGHAPIDTRLGFPVSPRSRSAAPPPS